jgi:putative heme-binding domain-containing protein
MGNNGFKAAAAVASLLIFAGCLSPFDFTARARQDNKSMIEAGQRVFAGSCGMSYCHGYNGIGGGGPKLRDREFTAASLTKMITDGIPGTSMPAFKTSLKKEQIAQVVAFLFTVNKEIKRSQPQANSHLAPGASKSDETSKSTKPAEPRATSIVPGAMAGVTGDAGAGESLFFDASQMRNCRACHTLHGRGGAVASDLSRLSDQSPREILLRILSPSPDGKYQNIAVTLKTGERIAGIRRDENETQLRIYDTFSLPPISRGLLKSEIATIEKLTTSGCSGNAASKFTIKELLDLVAFIKTSDPSKPAALSLKELF